MLLVGESWRCSNSSKLYIYEHHDVYNFSEGSFVLMTVTEVGNMNSPGFAAPNDQKARWLWDILVQCTL